MDDHKKRIIIGTSIVVATVVLLGLLLFSLFQPKKVDVNANKSMDVTSFYSPVTNTRDSLTVNYGGEVNPATDAVKQTFRIFDEANVPLGKENRAILDAILQEALLSQITPTYPVAYVHIVQNSIDCKGTDCTMKLYVDSPETYFKLALKSTDGIPSYALTQIPWEGLTNE